MIYRRVLLSTVTSLALLATAGMTTGASAQDVDPAPEAASGSSEIVVTAQRRAERLEDVPATVTAITPEALEKTGLTRYQDLGELSAGVQISRNGAYTQPSVRGITTLAVGSGIENNVATYVDGFYQTNPLVANADIANVESVQILKGPQGTLYGRNATGGAILISTLKPSNEFTGKVMLGYGNLDERRASVYLSGPINDYLKFSVAAYHRQNDGYIKDVEGWDAAPFKSQSLRAKLLFEPTDNLEVQLGYNYTLVDDPRGNIWVQRDQLPIRGVTIPAVARTYFDPATDTSAIDRSSTNYRSYFRIKQHEGTLTVRLKTGIGDLSSYTSYQFNAIPQKYDFDGTKRDYTTTIQDAHQRTFQQSLDYNIDAIENVSLTVGGMYYHDVHEIYGYRYVFNAATPEQGVLNGTSRLLAKSDALSGYIDGTWTPDDRLFVTVGGRYSWERKSLDHYNSLAPAATTNPPVSESFSAFTPRLNLRYELAPRTNVYASYSKGFKSGTYNLTAFTSLASIIPARQEEVTAYEAGFKTANSLFRFEGSVWFYDYTNIQTTVTTTIGTGVPQSLLQNAKSAESYGAEASGTITPIEGLNINAGVAYIRARYKDFANSVGTGLTEDGTLNVGSAIQDLSGQRMIRAPSWSGNVNADYSFPAFGGKMSLAGNLYFTTDYIPNNPSTGQSPETVTISANTYGTAAPIVKPGRPDDRTQRFVADGYVTVGGSIGWTDPSDQLTLTLWGRNLTNKRYLITWSAQIYGSYSQYSEPRTYGIRAEYKF